MILLIHGDNQVESRRRLAFFKSEAEIDKKEIIRLDGNGLELNTLIQSLEARSLFSSEKLVIIENLYSSRGNNNKSIQYLKQNAFEPDIVIWEPKKIDGRKSVWIKQKGKIEEFAYPKIMFKFLESIGFSNKDEILKLFKQLLNIQPPELVYFMIVRQLRLLLLAKFAPKNDKIGKIKETQKMQGWQWNRLKRQASNMARNKLLNSYKKLMFIDYQQKTGRSALDLKQTLDIFLTQL